MIKIDLHIHSKYSFDSHLEPKTIIEIAKKRNLDGIAITDHDSLKGSIEAKKISNDFLIIEGSEINTISGEILAYGIQEEIRPNLLIEETIDQIHEQGGIAVTPHPYDLFRNRLHKNIVKGIDGIEVINAGCILSIFNILAFIKAREMKLPMTAGSDAHTKKDIGTAFTVFEPNDDVIKMIKNGLCRPEGKLSMPPIQPGSTMLRLLNKI
jgi:hypothetical protein